MKYSIESMPHVNESMDRVHAWYEHKILDRIPVRFDSYDSMQGENVKRAMAEYNSVKDFWFDSEMQVALFEKGLEGKTSYGETFPIFYPNLGPSVYASYFGVEIEYGPDTSWAKHNVHDLKTFDTGSLKIDRECETFKKIDEMTQAALSRGKGRFFTGYTDLHPSMDCTADLVGPQDLCMALYDAPEAVKEITQRVSGEFPAVFDYYHARLKGQPSATWIGIPSDDPMHIPSCDFSAMISSEQFREFYLPALLDEVRLAKNIIFHLDGAGVARHLDILLEVGEIDAIQWVQGVGEGEAIMQWIPLIKKIQNAKKSVVVILKESEMKAFMREVSPEGIFLTMKAEYENQPEIIKMLEQWK